jgi:signal transduction histidine kinase
MTPRAARRLAWALWVVSLVLLLAGILMGLAGGIPGGQAVLGILLPAYQLTSATVGAMIASRHPGNAIGWLFLASALTWGFAGVATGIAGLGAAGAIAINERVLFADWLGTWLFIPGIYVPVTFLFLLFPDGHLPSRRWLWVATIASVGVAVVTLESALGPGPLEDAQILATNPYAVGDAAVWETVGLVAWLPTILGLLVSALALFVRFRRSSGETRQKMKWLGYAAVAVAALFLLAAAGFWVADVAGAGEVVGLVILPAVIIFALLLVPVATGIAILRHRLFDVEVVINRTVVYGVLAAFVTLIYVGIVVGIGALIGSRGNLLLSIVATALIALAFQPMRERARRFANRVVYGKRATPYEVMSQFAERMAGTYSLDEVLPRMARIAADGTGADRVEVWVRVVNELRLEASWPRESEPRMLQLTPNAGLPSIPDVDRAIPVTQRDEVLGAIAVAMPRTEALTPAGEKLLGDLASQAGLVLRNVRLIEELRASRQRLVAAQDQERRRLERDIHDGAQQELVALAVQLRLAEQIASKKAPDMAELLARIKVATQDALDNLRDLARGIYPPLLADQGLAAALESQARKSPVPVEVEPNGVGRYPQEAEAAAYFCVLEALQNIAKYANATRAVVGLSEDDGRLTFSVSDDGQGFDAETQARGSGLQNMADRLEALGGTLEIRSAPGQGTTVTGRIPVHRSGDGEGPVAQQTEADQKEPDRKRRQEGEQHGDQRLHVEHPAG